MKKNNFWLVLVLLAAVAIGLGLSVLREHYVQYKYHQQYCEELLDSSAPNTGYPKNYSAMRQYYHCVLSLNEDVNCYQKYRQEIIDCQQSSKEKMSEEEIKRHLAGGAIEEICQDTAKLCTESQKEFTGDEDLKKAMLILCIEKTRKACTDLGIEWK
ncbi:MAG: hypothetical protein WC460_00225 [Patescibacteria group bacterium]